MRPLPFAVGAALALIVSPTFAGNEECVNAANEASALRRDVQMLTKAREKLRVCAEEECPAVIRDECRKALDEVAASLPSVVLVAEEEGGEQVFDVRANVDGAPVLAHLDGKPVDVDPGVHTFIFQREGAQPVEVRLVLRAGQKNAEVRATFPRRNAGASEPDRRPPAAPVVTADPSPQGATLRGAGLVLAGAGLLGLGIGTFFGLRASSKQSDAHCPDNVCDPLNGGKPETLKEAQSAGNLSTIFFVAGGAFVAGGLAMYLFAPRGSSGPSARMRPVFGPHGAAVVIEGVTF